MSSSVFEQSLAQARRAHGSGWGYLSVEQQAGAVRANVLYRLACMDESVSSDRVRVLLDDAFTALLAWKDGEVESR